MKKFDFKLQRLLDIREAKEREIQNELAVVVSAQNRERAKQAELRENVERFRANIRSNWEAGIFDGQSAASYGRYEEEAQKAIAALEKKINALEPKAEEIRKRLVQASTEKKIVEKLKEKKQAEYKLEINRKIAKENDDINQKLYMQRLIEHGGVQ